MVKFLLFIRDNCKTSQTAIENVASGLHHFINQLSSVLLVSFMLILIFILSKIFYNIDPELGFITIEKCFEIIEQTLLNNSNSCTSYNNYNMNKFLMNNLNMIPPKAIQLNRTMVWKHKPKLDLIEKESCGYYLSLLSNLRRLLANEQVCYCVDNPRNDGDVMKSVLDGQYYKLHEIFSKTPNSLAIILYYDELEIANPLGSRTHKIGMFYWSLANIYPEWRSSFRAINLLAIAYYTDIVKGGLNKILNEVVSEIKILQNEGITVFVNGMEKLYKGSLLMVTGDTPASAFLGGFKMSVSAGKPCRTCMTDQDRWKRFFTERAFTLRNMESHLNHLEIIEEPEMLQTTREYWKKNFGINTRSKLIDILHFDVTMCLVQDIMHILCEGVLEVATRLLINFCIQERKITLETLNNRITSFNYGHMQRDKPSLIKICHLKTNLKQSAAQMLCLAYVLPFLINDNLFENRSENNAIYDRLLLHTRLLQITNICFAYEVTRNDATYLVQLIQIFLSQFNILYPNSMVPKFHFLVHIPRQLIFFGPARQQFCMRFEVAHVWFKTLARVVKNFKNIPLSLSYRYESLRCSELAGILGESSVKFLYTGHKVNEGNVLDLADIPERELLISFLSNLHNQLSISLMLTKKITVHGTTYEPGSIILLKCEENDMPIFGQITKIYSHGEDFLLLYKEYDTLYYCPTLNAYLIQDSPLIDTNVKKMSDLIHPHPLSIFVLQNSKFVVLFNYTRTEFIQ